MILFDIALETCLRRNATRERVVPQEAVIRQYNFFQETLKSIKNEGFDSVYIMNENDQSLVTVEIVPAV